jgi:hypothetical protein
VIIPGSLFVEPVTVETYRGSGAYGDVYEDPVTVYGHVSGGRRLSRSVQGDQVSSEQRLMLPNPARQVGGGTLDPAALLTPESRVTAGAISSTATSVVEHRKPGTGQLVYVSGLLT